VYCGCQQGLDVRKISSPGRSAEVFFLDIPFYRTRLELQDAGIREETNLLSCLVALEQGGPVRSAPGEVERDR
jgi:hypothetical protein